MNKIQINKIPIIKFNECVIDKCFNENKQIYNEMVKLNKKIQNQFIKEIKKNKDNKKFNISSLILKGESFIDKTSLMFDEFYKNKKYNKLSKCLCLNCSSEIKQVIKVLKLMKQNINSYKKDIKLIKLFSNNDKKKINTILFNIIILFNKVLDTFKIDCKS